MLTCFSDCARLCCRRKEAWSVWVSFFFFFHLLFYHTWLHLSRVESHLLIRLLPADSSGHLTLFFFSFNLISCPFVQCLTCWCAPVCLQAGSAEGCHRERAGAGEAGPAGAHGAEDGAGARAGAEGDLGEAAEHGAEEQRWGKTEVTDGGSQLFFPRYQSIWQALVFLLLFFF